MVTRFWLDDRGAILSAELVLLMVLTVIGLVVGLTALRDAVVLQQADLAGAVYAIDPSFGWSGLQSTQLINTANTGGAFVNASFYTSPAVVTNGGGQPFVLQAIPPGESGKAVSGE